MLGNMHKHLQKYWLRWVFIITILPLAMFIANAIVEITHYPARQVIQKTKSAEYETPIAQQDSQINKSPAAATRKAELEHLWGFDVRIICSKASFVEWLLAPEASHCYLKSSDTPICIVVLFWHFNIRTPQARQVSD